MKRKSAVGNFPPTEANFVELQICVSIQLLGKINFEGKSTRQTSDLQRNFCPSPHGLERHSLPNFDGIDRNLDGVDGVTFPPAEFSVFSIILSFALLEPIKVLFRLLVLHNCRIVRFSFTS